MEAPYAAPQAPVAAAGETATSAVSWPAIFAGTAVAIAISVVLIALGSGLGLASFTPSARNAASAGTLAALGTVWVVIVQWLSAASGGYVTGRLRVRWMGTHPHEVFFRDTAHGFVTWALATAIVAVLVTSATSSLFAGGLRAAATATPTGGNASTSVTPYDVDTLFRPAATPPSPSISDGRGEAVRILTHGVGTGSFPAADRTYLASLVADRTGLSPADAQQRVDQVIALVQQQADKARKAAATTALLTALAMLIGAFIACVAAALGGHERDRHP